MHGLSNKFVQSNSLLSLQPRAQIKRDSVHYLAQALDLLHLLAKPELKPRESRHPEKLPDKFFLSLDFSLKDSDNVMISLIVLEIINCIVFNMVSFLGLIK